MSNELAEKVDAYRKAFPTLSERERAVAEDRLWYMAQSSVRGVTRVDWFVGEVSVPHAHSVARSALLKAGPVSVGVLWQQLDSGEITLTKAHEILLKARQMHDANKTATVEDSVKLLLAKWLKERIRKRKGKVKPPITTTVITPAPDTALVCVSINKAEEKPKPDGLEALAIEAISANEVVDEYVRRDILKRMCSDLRHTITEYRLEVRRKKSTDSVEFSYLRKRTAIACSWFGIPPPVGRSLIPAPHFDRAKRVRNKTWGKLHDDKLNQEANSPGVNSDGTTRVDPDLATARDSIEKQFDTLKEWNDAVKEK